jgi:hypothetical protein
MSGELDRLRSELADYDARESARHLRQRPGWRIALDDLLIANYANDAFWFGDRAAAVGGLTSVLFGAVSDDDMWMVRAWFARKCRICQRPMHENDVRIGRCRDCGADNSRPQVVAGSVVTEREIREITGQGSP